MLVPAAVPFAPAAAAQDDVAGPVFADGQAQIVEAFSDPAEWIQHDLWVETEFDSDGDGKLDRMHVDVTRQAQTDDGLKVPVVYETSPYYSGTGSTAPHHFWNPRHELGDYPPFREMPPPIRFQPRRPLINGSHIQDWVPRADRRT